MPAELSNGWGLKKIISDSADSTTVMIFWANWCNPSIRDIPIFEKIRKEKVDKESGLCKP
jgi:thiol-disulfide isomerase/thioredoxin